MKEKKSDSRSKGRKMKSVVVIPIEPGSKEDDRRKAQRRLAVPRRLQSTRRSFRAVPANHQSADRRMPGDRRRLPDRRLGLRMDVDLSDLE